MSAPQPSVEGRAPGADPDRRGSCNHPLHYTQSKGQRSHLRVTGGRAQQQGVVKYPTWVSRLHPAALGPAEPRGSRVEVWALHRGFGCGLCRARQGGSQGRFKALCLCKRRIPAEEGLLAASLKRFSGVLERPSKFGRKKRQDGPSSLCSHFSAPAAGLQQRKDGGTPEPPRWVLL